MDPVLFDPAWTRRSTWFAGLVFGLVGALLPAACSSTPELEGEARSCDSDQDCGPSQFCAPQGVCDAVCPSCGQECTITDDCPVGQFCSAGGSCQQQCIAGRDEDACSGGLVCSEDGQCAGENTIEIGGGGGTGDGDGDGDAQSCIDVEVAFTPQIPNVVLLIDQSGSMDARDSFGAAVSSADGYEPWDCPNADQNWRWNVVRNVLFHPDTGVVKPLEHDVRFGYASYTNVSGTCPQLEEVSIDFGTHAAMLEEHACSDLQPNANTPTRESLTAVAESLAATDLDGPKVIVLATDGAPDNCACPNWGGSGSCAGFGCNEADQVARGDLMLCPEIAEQYDVVAESFRIHQELGITVEVINVSSPGNTGLAGHLDNVAEAGGAVGGVAIPGFDPGALASAFQSIIDGVRSCAIDLDGRIEEGKEETGTVRLDQDPTEAVDFEELQLDDPDGWRVNAPTQIELLGEACETLESGERALDISFPCGSFVLNPR